MAAPAYNTDLVDITLSESTTGWTALGGGASGLGTGADFSMQGTLCVDKQVSAAEKGHIFDNGSGITPGANEHFFLWAFLATPGLAATIANRGLAMILGTATTAYTAFHVEGVATYGARGRVGKCYPIRYRTDASASPPYRTLTGSPGAAPRYFGATANITGTVKGANLGIDAIRRGTGVFITAGEVAGSATFSGLATQNDSISNRWGVFTAAGGSNYELQGRCVIGQNSSGTPTAAYFSDANKNILLIDTPHTLTDFTQIIADHASTTVIWTNITIEAAGTNNPGQVVFNNASTVGTLTNCTFVKIGATTLRAGVTATDCTWRQCGAVTLNGATVTGALISNSTAAASVIAATLNNLTGNRFVSDGSNYAVDLGTISASVAMTWNNLLTGYAATNGSTGNEAIKVNVASGQTLTINITAGASTPSVHNTGAGTVTLVSSQFTLTISSQVSLAGAEIRIYDDDNSPAGYYGTELAGTESNAGATYQYTSAAGNDIVVQIMHSGYVEYIQRLTTPTANQALFAELKPEVND